MLTTQELKKLDPKKLQEELLKAKRELFKIKFEVRNGQSKSHHLIEKSRKYIARIKTLINQQP
jgi:large subunit ribosomal protein L29